VSDLSTNVLLPGLAALVVTGVVVWRAAKKPRGGWLLLIPLVTVPVASCAFWDVPKPVALAYGVLVLAVYVQIRIGFRSRAETAWPRRFARRALLGFWCVLALQTFFWAVWAREAAVSVAWGHWTLESLRRGDAWKERNGITSEGADGCVELEPSLGERIDPAVLGDVIGEYAERGVSFRVLTHEEGRARAAVPPQVGPPCNWIHAERWGFNTPFLASIPMGWIRANSTVGDTKYPNVDQVVLLQIGPKWHYLFHWNQYR